MVSEKKGFAVASGVFLLFYAAPVTLLYLFYIGAVFWSEWPERLEWFLTITPAFMTAVAAIFLIRRNPRRAALWMTLAFVLTLAQQIPEIPRYLEPNGYLAAYYEADNYAEYIPREYVVLPILQILAALCLASALYLRGWPALALSLLSAVGTLCYLFLWLNSSAYVTGHPHPANLFCPLNYAMSALFAGLYLLSLRKRGLSPTVCEKGESYGTGKEA